MITHALNAEEVSNLIRAHLCDDLTIVSSDNNHTIIRSDKDKFVGKVVVYPIFSGVATITKDEHDELVATASDLDYSTLFIAATPDGVFQFNLSLIRLGFETYSDPEAGVELSLAQVDVSNGVQILEWYPEFESEDAYIDALMSNGDDIKVWDDGDNW
jgi:hypothetical protein